MTVAAATRRGRSWASRVAGCVAADYGLAARLLVWRAGLPLLKRALSIETLVKLMHTTPKVRREVQHPGYHASRIREFLARGGRTLVSRNCLERSLVQYRLLSQTGAAPTLVLGARKDGSAVTGHAWVEVDRKPFDTMEAGQYVPLVVFGTDGRPQYGLDPRPAA